MYNQRVIDVAELPLPISQRKYTDVLCTWLHALFVLGLIAAAFLQLPRNHPQSHAAGSLSRKVSCAQGQLQIWSQNQTEGLLCVQTCPKNFANIDDVCYPTQKQQLKLYLETFSLTTRWEQSNFKGLLLLIITFVLGLSLVLFAITYFVPKIIQRAIMLLAIAILVCLVIMLIGVLEWPQPLERFLSDLSMQEKKILMGICGLLALFLMGWLICFNKELSWNGVMLMYASNILPDNLAFIPLVFKYYIGLALVFAVFAFQSYAFSQSSSLFYSWAVLPEFTALQILNILELFWNLQYLKDTLYFSLCNLAGCYYFDKQIDCCGSLKLNCLHAGSTSGGAFVSTLFYLPNCLLEAACCFPQEKRENCGLACTSLTGIARQDAYALQSLSGIPYCNSSRECRRLSNESYNWIGVNSPLSSFRFFLHVFSNVVCIIFAYVAMQDHLITISFWRVFAIFIVCEGLMSGLIDVLPAIAESLQTAVLVDTSISGKSGHIYERLSGHLHGRKVINPFSD